MLNVKDTAAGKVSTDTEEPVGCRIPYSVFTDDSFYKAEQEHLFRGPTWNFVALEAEVPNPGDFKSTFIGDTPVVVTRGAMTHGSLTDAIGTISPFICGIIDIAILLSFGRRKCLIFLTAQG